MMLNPDQVLAMVMWANTTAGLVHSDPNEAVRYASSDETPIPADLWPSRVADMPTGQDLVGPVEDLVLTASAVQRMLAILPVDQEQERIVEEYIREHSPQLSGRRISRRGPRILLDS